MLGVPLKVYQDYFTPNIKTRVKATTDPLSVSTSMYIEVDIARELGMTLEEYQKLSRRERKIQMFFRVLSSEKERHAYEESRAKAEREAQLNQQANSPQGRFR